MLLNKNMSYQAAVGLVVLTAKRPVFETKPYPLPALDLGQVTRPSHALTFFTWKMNMMIVSLS